MLFKLFGSCYWISKTVRYFFQLSLAVLLKGTVKSYWDIERTMSGEGLGTSDVRTCYKCKSSGPTPELLTLNSGGRMVCVLSRPPGDSNIHWSLRTTAVLHALQAKPVVQGQGCWICKLTSGQSYFEWKSTEMALLGQKKQLPPQKQKTQHQTN